MSVECRGTVGQIQCAYLLLGGEQAVDDTMSIS